MKLLSYLLYGSFLAVVVMTLYLAITAEPYPKKTTSKRFYKTDSAKYYRLRPFVTKDQPDSVQWRPVIINDDY